MFEKPVSVWFEKYDLTVFEKPVSVWFEKYDLTVFEKPVSVWLIKTSDLWLTMNFSPTGFG